MDLRDYPQRGISKIPSFVLIMVVGAVVVVVARCALTDGRGVEILRRPSTHKADVCRRQECGRKTDLKRQVPTPPARHRARERAAAAAATRRGARDRSRRTPLPEAPSVGGGGLHGGLGNTDGRGGNATRTGWQRAGGATRASNANARRPRRDRSEWKGVGSFQW